MSKFLHQFLYVGLAASLAVVPASGNASDGNVKTVYKVAIDREYAPYEFVDRDGTNNGFTPHLLREIGKSAGATFIFIPMDWPEAVAALEGGRIDLINMIRTPQRLGQYEFSEPHSRIKQAIFRHISATGISDLESLAGHRVALQRNDISFEMLVDYTDFTRVLVQDKAEGFLLLNSGKVDAFLAADQAGLRLIREYDLSNVEPAAVGLFPQDFCFAARKGNRRLINRLNAGLKQLKATGRYQEIAGKWFSLDISEQNWFERHWRLLAGFIGVLVFLLAAFVVWNATLRRTIALRTRALQEKQNLLLEAQHIAHVGNWWHDLVTGEIYWSDEFFNILGIEPQKPSLEMGFAKIHPDDLPILMKAMDESVGGQLEHEQEFRIIRPDGEVRWIHNRWLRINDRDGKEIKRVGTHQDITERKRMEEKIRTLNRELEQRVAARTADLEAANRELESFSYSVSHDLRAPLRAIDGFSNILLEDYRDKLDDEGKRLLNVVRENTSKMGQLIEDILNFSRTGRLELTFSEIDMEGMAHAVFEELGPFFGDNKVQLEVEPLPSVRGDSAMLHQVFVNLLSNAIKFSRTKKKPVIQVGASVKDNEIVFYVKDNGVGFDMQYVDKLFGVFQRMHSENEFEGTGIGLAIVKRIITRHGGRVWAEGKVNEGATFYFSLPHSTPEAVHEYSDIQ